MITKTLFGTLKDGQAVWKYRITNAHGEYAEVLDYGACLHSLFILDKNGQLGDVVLGVQNAEELEAGIGLAGITVGRCANRIAYGRFPLNGQTVQLECNQRGHHLHGASGGYGKQLFTFVPCEEENTVCLQLLDEGQGGYGNRVSVTVRYTFGNDRRLRIRYHMMPEEDTLLCPTNHAYFNLDGFGDIRQHQMQIFAQTYAVRGESGIPEGETAPVSGTPLDFRQSQPIGNAYLDPGTFFRGDIPQMDDTFLLKDTAGTMTLAARLISQKSGRIIEVYTDMPAMIVFTRFIRQDMTGKHGIRYHGYCSIALETQYVPNAINCTGFDIPLFPAGVPLDSETVYAFRNMSEEGV